MLPVIPFDILQPLAIAAVLLCLGTVSIIVGRRGVIRYYTREGERSVEQAESLLKAARDKGATTELTKWIDAHSPGRIEGIVRAAERLGDSDGEVRGWLGETGLASRFAEILVTSPGKKVKRRERWARVAAAHAIGRLGLTSEIESLADAMEDEDEEVAYAAADALSLLDTPPAAEAILNEISAKPRLNNSRLASYVESMTCELTEVFREQLRRDDSAALFWTATLIGEKELFDLVVDVRPLLESKDANVRAASAECVGELKIPLTDRWLGPLLQDEMWFVQSHAAKALGELRAVWAIDELVDLLHENEWWLRQNAADALVKIGRDAADAVERLLHDKDRFARNSAVEILERIDWINMVLERATRDDPQAEGLLRQFGVCGGLGYLENALFTAPEDGVPILLEILRELGDDATYGRVRAAAEQMPERFRPLALTVASEVRAR